MKRQKTAKVFKIIYFIISALWMAWWGGAVLFAIAGPTEDKIIAFFTMLIPIPVYYILKGFFVGSEGTARLYFVINFIVSLILANYYFVQNALLKTCHSASDPSKCKSSFLSLRDAGHYDFLENNIFESLFWTRFFIVFVALTIFYWILKWVVKGFKKNK